jgi:hypothetical protein
MRAVVKDMLPCLRELGIVYGMHFTQVKDERTCRIVLECIPFVKTLNVIQQRLQETVRDIPSRPAVIKTVRDERTATSLISSR